jgi:hypothetical protein
LSAGEVPTAGRPKGLPKTGGRRKGTPNRATISFRERLAARGYDPIDELITISRDHKTPLETRVQIHLEICPYIYPKRKPVDQSIGEPVSINVITDLEGEGGVTNARAGSSSETEAKPS